MFNVKHPIYGFHQKIYFKTQKNVFQKVKMFHKLKPEIFIRLDLNLLMDWK